MTKKPPAKLTIFSAKEVCQRLKIPQRTLSNIYNANNIGTRTTAGMIFTPEDMEAIAAHRAKHPRPGRIKAE